MARITKSTRKNKQLMVTRKNGKTIHFGDPNMKEYPGTKRGDNYCTRSYGITDKQGTPTRNNKNKANYWSRTILWNCKGKKSQKK